MKRIVTNISVSSRLAAWSKNTLAINKALHSIKWSTIILILKIFRIKSLRKYKIK